MNNFKIQKEKNCKALTLAEVLITLQLIGVVDAITIPSVVKNYQKTQVITKVKKAYSVLNQAYNQSQAQNGMYQTWDSPSDFTQAIEYFEKYWKPYLKVQKICKSYSDCGYKQINPWKAPDGNYTGTNVVSPAARTTFITTDGILFVIYNTDLIRFDINNSNEPNQFGKDVFVLRPTNKGILPDCYNYTKSNIDQGCLNNGGCCAAKIMKDAWEIKDDYPW